MTEEAAIESLLKKCAGVIDVGQNASSYHDSECTSGVTYDQTLMVGNHDLLIELQREQGKFILFRIHVLPTA